jgi:hypothetical protein
MNKTLLILLVSLFLFGCNKDKDLKKYYPSGYVMVEPNSSGSYDKRYSDIYKDFTPRNEIYIDNSKINNFELFMIYNDLDTVWGYNEGMFGRKLEAERIFILDTLKFQVTKEGVLSLNDKFEGVYYMFADISKFNSRGDSLYIKVYDGEDVNIIIKKDEEIIESYNVDLIAGGGKGIAVPEEYWGAGRGNRKIDYHYQYIINPLSKSRFKLDSIRYGGYLFRDFKSKIYSSKFIKIKGKKIDYFLTTPPDTLSYSYNSRRLDPCLIGCTKSVIKQIR